MVLRGDGARPRTSEKATHEDGGDARGRITNDRSRDRDRDRGRDRGRDRRRDRSLDRSRDRSRDLSLDRSRDRSSDLSLDRSRDRGRGHSRDRGRGHSRDRGRGHSRDRNRGHSRDRNRGHSRDRGRGHSRDRGRGPKERRRAKAAKKDSMDTNQLDELSTYTNDNNPFNDYNLGQKFVWTKKSERDKRLGVSEAELARRERERREEAKEELEKLAKRRAEREIEQQLREQEMMRMQREADLAALGDWQVKEDEFHLEQAKKRAEIRIKENRAKPIDVLAINLRLVNSTPDEGADDVGVEVDLEEPYHIFDNLTLQEVEELHRDIQFYLSLEKVPWNVEFWNAMIVVAEDTLGEMRSLTDRRLRTGYETVSQTANSMFVGKTYQELLNLQQQIQRKLSSNEPLDIEYWEGVLKALTVWKAKAKLKTMHQTMLEKRLEQLRTTQRKEALRDQSEVAAGLAGHLVRQVAKGKPAEEEAEEEVEEATPELEIIPYEKEMSPVPFDIIAREERDVRQVDPDEDWAQLLARREEVARNKLVPLKPQGRAADEPPEEESDVSGILYSKEASKPADLDEFVFNTEAELAKTTYLWQDKYRPRKPRYFNRVHTGYEWNKYNQTHYDTDNPPPKVVQGYKFNIFYPDLIDKSKTPTYQIEKEAGTSETVLMRFIGGPPYEDIAFRIVNREWEYSHKKGFKSSFDRGVLQLHFHFKRNFYRK